MNKETIGNSEINTDSGISKSNRINTKVLITASIVLSTLNNEPAPVGTVINASIGGELRGSVTVTTAGEYNLLGVEGSSSDDGATITFTVGGVDADQTAIWYEGNEPRPLDLTTTGLPQTGDIDGDDDIDMDDVTYLAKHYYGTGLFPDYGTIYADGDIDCDGDIDMDDVTYLAKHYYGMGLFPDYGTLYPCE
jgi:hypothetical protein